MKGKIVSNQSIILVFFLSLDENFPQTLTCGNFNLISNILGRIKISNFILGKIVLNQGIILIFLLLHFMKNFP